MFIVSLRITYLLNILPTCIARNTVSKTRNGLLLLNAIRENIYFILLLCHSFTTGNTRMCGWWFEAITYITMHVVSRIFIRFRITWKLEEMFPGHWLSQLVTNKWLHGRYWQRTWQSFYYISSLFKGLTHVGVNKYGLIDIFFQSKSFLLMQ